MKAKLQTLSELLIDHLLPAHRLYREDEVQDNWLGYPPASPQAIEAKEKELGITLPVAYKNFLSITDGFRQLTHFIGHLFPVRQINWIKVAEPYLLEAYEDMADYDHLIHDDDLKRYDAANSSKWRYADFAKTVVISGWGDAAILLLNPNSGEPAEYEVWEFTNWYPGAVRFRNFDVYLDHCILQAQQLLKNKPENSK